MSIWRSPSYRPFTLMTASPVARWLPWTDQPDATLSRSTTGASGRSARTPTCEAWPASEIIIAFVGRSDVRTNPYVSTQRIRNSVRCSGTLPIPARARARGRHPGGQRTPRQFPICARAVEKRAVQRGGSQSVPAWMSHGSLDHALLLDGQTVHGHQLFMPAHPGRAYGAPSSLPDVRPVR
jgi:hypothetical protein